MAIEVSIVQSDIDYAKAFMTQYLTDKMPEADFSEGTGLQDLVVKAMAYSFAFLRSELTKIQTLRSLQRLAELDDDDEVNEAVDDIISNFFINRGGGTKARVGVTVELSQRADIIANTEVPFDRDGTHIFYPEQLYAIPKEDLIEKTASSGQITYEFDMTLEAAEIGESYEVPAGNFVSWGQFSPYVLSVRNGQKASGGGEEETNANYIERSQDAITVRNLINAKSIRTVLLEGFKDQGIKDVTTIGYTDPEMLRDTINTNVTWSTIDLVHIGNHQDIYVNLPLVEEQTYTAISETEQYLGEPDRPGAIKLPNVPIYKIHSVKDSITDDDLPYHLFVRDHRYVFTKEQEIYVILNSGTDGKSVEIVYDTVEGFDLIHNFLRDPDERIILANTLARAVIPIYVEVNIPYRQVSGKPELDETAAINTVIEFVDALNNTDELNIDQLLGALHTNYGDSIIIQNPLSVKGTVSYPNGTTQVFYSDNVLSVPEFEALGVTNRVCGYYTSNKYITFTKRT